MIGVGEMTMIEPSALKVQSDGLMKVEPPEPASELEEFVYIVSHDLRNSARALTEVPVWLREDMASHGVQLHGDVLEDLELLERHARRLDRMLLDLLVYSRVGRLQEVTRVPLSALLERVVAECSVPDRIEVSCPAPLPVLTIGYKDIFVLFKSLIDNVVMHCGGLETTLQISGWREDDLVTLEFLDNGPGVPLRDLERIFRPMVTLTRRDEKEASGMGLATVQRITRHYNGSVFAGIDKSSGGLRVRVTLSDRGLEATERFGIPGLDPE